MKRLLPAFILIILSWFTIHALLGPGYFPMHDDTQIARVVEMGKALKEGQFPVRWVPDLGYGYGYPIYNFYGPLPYYFGGILFALGVSGLMATKIMFGVGLILPSVFLYFATVDVIGIPAATIAGLFYLYAPYHAVEVFVRGAVGEYWILVFWPMLLYGLIWAGNRRRPLRAVIVGSMGLAASILSHTLLGYATTVFLLISLFLYWIAMLVRKRFDKRVARTHIGIVIFGLGLSAFFWIPALFEMQFTSVAYQVGSTANYHDHFVCLIQLWSSAWGYGGSSPGCSTDGLSFMLGKLHVVMGIMALVLWMVKRLKRNSMMLAGIGAVAAIGGVFLTLQISQPLWNILPMFSYLQYPWRFLAAATFGLSILSGLGITAIPSFKWQTIAALVLAVSVIALNAKWFVPQYLYVRDTKVFESLTDIRWRVSRISDEYLPPDLPRPTSIAAVPSDTIVSGSTISVTPIVRSVTQGKYIVESTTSAEITVNRAYFPGWQYIINGNPVLPRVVSGLPRFTIDAGQSIIDFRLSDTPIRTVANSISAVASILGLLWYVKHKKTNG